jgi:hypothetical protein
VAQKSNNAAVARGRNFFTAIFYPRSSTKNYFIVQYG